MNGAVPPLSHMPLWRAERQLYLLLWNGVHKEPVTNSLLIHEYILRDDTVSHLSQNSELHRVIHLCVCDLGREMLH
jgi:hypothetical protein